MGIVFHAHNHTYLNEQGNQYISVTTLLKRYTPPFDEDYWSSYKALKDVLCQAGMWSVYKDKAGGWEYVLDHCRKIKNFPYRDSIIQRKKYYIQEWRQKGEDARAKGTLYHQEAEKSIRKGTVILEDLREIDVISNKDLLVAPDFTTSGLYPELLIYNDKHRIAGQADWVLKEKNKVHIKDYKTSREIETEAFREETLLTPLNHLPNANFWIYSMQISMYAWMLECKGFKVGTLSIEHIRNEYETVSYPVKYLRNDVHALIRHYESERKKEQRKDQSSLGKTSDLNVSA